MVLHRADAQFLSAGANENNISMLVLAITIMLC